MIVRPGRLRSKASAGAVIAAPSGLTYGTNPASYVEDMAISSNSPSVTGSVTGYTVSPSLPTGMAIDATTGVITGTPTTPTALALYTVTATGPGGSTTCDVSITITIAAPSGLTYGTNPASYPTGGAISSNSPSVSGGAVASYSVSPALPAGLSLHATTGVITGTPTAPGTTSATYVVTATNAGGSTTCDLVLKTTPCQAWLEYIFTGNIANGDIISTLYGTGGSWPTGGSPNATGGRGMKWLDTVTNATEQVQRGATLLDSLNNAVAFHLIYANQLRQVATVTGGGTRLRITAGTTDFPGASGNALLCDIKTDSGGVMTLSHNSGANMTGGSD